MLGAISRTTLEICKTVYNEASKRQLELLSSNAYNLSFLKSTRSLGESVSARGIGRLKSHSRGGEILCCFLNSISRESNINMKFEIQTYKDQTIYYDEFEDRFVCDISIEDNSKSTKRNKLEDVRKEIDKFIKANLDFKPFKVIEISGRVSIYTIESIRSDGTFVVIGEYHKSYKTAKEVEDRFLVYDADVISKDREYEDRIESVKKDRTAFLKSVQGTLQRPNLSKYKI